MNSKLTGEAVVAYNETTNCFIFTPIVKNTGEGYSCRVTRGISDTRPVEDIVLNKPLKLLSQILIADTSINPFVEDTTKMVILTVKKSMLSMDMLNHYLADITHWIATTEDSKDEHSFNIILPLNVQIDKSSYKFVAMSIAEQLLLKVLPEDCEPAMVYHGRNGATQLTSNVGSTLYDVSGVLANAVTTSTVPRLATKSASKPTQSAVQKYINSEILDNREMIIDYANITSTPILFLAGLVYSMRCKWTPDDVLLDTIESINGSLENSFSKEEIEQYVLSPFKDI